MTIGSAPEHQIFGDQRSSGLWSLYQRAARDSGLVDRQRRLTPTGHRLTQRWLENLPPTLLTKVRNREPRQVIFGRVGQPSADAVSIATLLVKGDREDRSLLKQTLVEGVVPDGAGGAVLLADGRQQRLAGLMLRHRTPQTWRRRLHAMQRDAQVAGDDDLADRLAEVQVTESVLHPAQAAFDALLLGGNGARPRDFAEQVGAAWPKVPGSVRALEFRRAIEPMLWRPVGAACASIWADAAQSMAGGRWERVLENLVAINADTMSRRGGAPWVRPGSGGTYDVRLPSGAQLPDEAEILDGWRNPYYLFPLLSLQRDLLARGRL